VGYLTKMLNLFVCHILIYLLSDFFSSIDKMMTIIVALLKCISFN